MTFMKSFEVDYEAHAEKHNHIESDFTLSMCVGTDLLWLRFGPGTNMDEEDGRHTQFGF